MQLHPGRSTVHPMPRKPELITLSQIADALGIDHSTAFRRAKRCGIKPTLQTPAGDLYRPADMVKIAVRPKLGRPLGSKKKGAK